MEKILQTLGIIVLSIIVAFMGFFARLPFSGQMKSNSLKAELLIAGIIGLMFGIIASIMSVWSE